MKKDLASGTDVVYLYDNWQVLEEREWDTNGEGAEDDKWEPRRQFVYGGQYIDEPLVFDKDTDNDGVCDDARYFYCQQANWNVVAVTGSDATVVEKIKYDPYGEATVTVEQGQSASGNPYLFQGRRWDSEIDLYYFRNRVYSPVLGRFLQRDPKGYVDGYCLYEYAKSRPTGLTDPTGEWISAALKAVPCLMCIACSAGVVGGCAWECSDMPMPWDECFFQCAGATFRAFWEDCKCPTTRWWRRLHACACDAACLACVARLMGAGKFPWPPPG